MAAASMAEYCLFDLYNERSELNFVHMFFAAKFNPVKNLKNPQKFTCELFVDRKQSRHRHLLGVVKQMFDV